MAIPVQYVTRAELPNGITLERVGENLFLLRREDHVWDWGLYEWNPRWVFDCVVDKKIDRSWFVGRYLVEADKIQHDLRDGLEHFGPMYLPPKPTERPSWFNGR